MSQMSEMDSVIKDLRDAASSINSIANYLGDLFMAKDEPAPEPEKKPLAFEEVRAILAQKARDGFKDQIKAILERHGSAKLSELDPSSYEAVVAEAEALGNG